MSDGYVIATEPLFVGVALAHPAGDLVPVANVKLNGWQDKVAKPGTAAAGKATAQHDES